MGDLTSLICDVCPRACKLEEDQVGSCGVRKNVGGLNTNRIHGEIAEVYCWPGKFVDICFPGCGSRCPWCITASFHDALACQTRPMDEKDIPGLVRSQLGPPGYGLPTARFTGGEPGLHYEYVAEVAQRCREQRLLTLLVTNGYISSCFAAKLAKAVDVPIVGFKGSGSPLVYARMQVDPQVVFDATKVLWLNNRQTEVSTLIGPGLDCERGDHERLADWIIDNLDANVGFKVEILCKSMAIPGAEKYRILPTQTEGIKNGLKVAELFADRGLTRVGAPRLRGVVYA